MNLQLLEPAIASHILWNTSVIGIALRSVLLFAAAAFALDPQKAITQFVHRAWTEEDGAPADVFAITQTNDGYLWLGKASGLFSFDGVRFRVLSRETEKVCRLRQFEICGRLAMEVCGWSSTLAK